MNDDISWLVLKPSRNAAHPMLSAHERKDAELRYFFIVSHHSAIATEHLGTWLDARQLLISIGGRK